MAIEYLDSAVLNGPLVALEGVRKHFTMRS